MFNIFENNCFDIKLGQLCQKNRFCINSGSITVADEITSATFEAILLDKRRTINSITPLLLKNNVRLYKYTASINPTLAIDASEVSITSEYFLTFELEINAGADVTSITLPANCTIINGETSITLQTSKKNLLAFRSEDGTNWICNYQGYY
jgi:hypothetical protein